MFSIHQCIEEQSIRYCLVQNALLLYKRRQKASLHFDSENCQLAHTESNLRSHLAIDHFREYQMLHSRTHICKSSALFTQHKNKVYSKQWNLPAPSTDESYIILLIDLSFNIYQSVFRSLESHSSARPLGVVTNRQYGSMAPVYHRNAREPSDL